MGLAFDFPRAASADSSVRPVLRRSAEAQPGAVFERNPNLRPPGKVQPQATDAAARTSALLQVDDVSLEYRTPERVVRATHRVSFDVHEADRFVLLGPSGCGKSTLLKAIAGFIPPVEGEIRLDGRRVTAPGPDRIVVFQEFDQLPPWKTVLANVAFPLLASRRVPRRDAYERSREVLAQVGLAEFADAFPHQLSGGMKQRVAIARALAMRPRVLLMDEPFASLDALTRQRMQHELLALWDRVGFTLLFVTHSIEEAVRVGSRVGVLSPPPGRLRAELDTRPDPLDPMPEHTAAARVARLRALMEEPGDAP